MRFLLLCKLHGLIADVPLWLGLKQFPALNPNQTFNEGWYWLDGRELDPSMEFVG